MIIRKVGVVFKVKIRVHCLIGEVGCVFLRKNLLIQRRNPLKVNEVIDYSAPVNSELIPSSHHRGPVIRAFRTIERIFHQIDQVTQ